MGGGLSGAARRQAVQARAAAERARAEATEAREVLRAEAERARALESEASGARSSHFRCLTPREFWRTAAFLTFERQIRLNSPPSARLLIT